MHYSKIVALIGLLATSANAIPNNIFERQRPAVCNRDDCLRAIVGRSATGSVDCQSFLRRTVSPCPATSTTTNINTETAPEVTLTTTFVTQQTNTVTSNAPPEITTTTQTTTVTSTVTTTVARDAGGGQQKRGQNPTPLAVHFESSPEGNFEKRVVEVCPTTTVPSNIPRYATACGANTSRYSSACLCNGASATVTTLPSTTVIVTQQTTTTVTPVTTLVQTITNTNEVITTVSTTLTSTEISTTTAVVTATVTAQPASGNFLLTSSNGRRVFYNSGSSGFNLILTAQNSVIFFIDELGALKAGGGALFFANVALTGSDIVNLQNPGGYNLGVADVNKVYCSVASPPRTGALSCSAGPGGNTQAVFSDCSGTLYLSTANPVGCTEITLTATPFG